MPIYLDYNATTPLREEVVAEMQPFLTAGVSSPLFGNPSSSHLYGRAAKTALELARTRIARCLNAAHPDEILLVSGATESLNSALIGGAMRQRELGRGHHLISCAIEHIATLQILQHLQKQGFDVTILPVDNDGRVSAEQVSAALRPDTCLVSLMLANNESGSILPIADIARAIRSTSVKDGRTIWLHTDASQAVGKHPVDVQALDVDLLTVAGHKLYAPKGVGALYVRQSTVGAVGGVCKIMHGANHELNRRAGTENVLLVVGLGKACEVAANELDQTLRRFTELRDALQRSIQDELQKLVSQYGLQADAQQRYDSLVHAPFHRLANTLSVGFHLILATDLLHRLSAHIAASAGAACHSDSVQLSYVLQAMRVPPEYGMGTVRLSVGRYNTLEEVNNAGKWIAQTVADMWREQKQGEYAKITPQEAGAGH